jgi:hypothetical protein
MRSKIRTPSQIIGYGLYFYFLGLSFRNAVKALYFLHVVKISHILLGIGFKNTIQIKCHQIRKRILMNVLVYER